VRLHLPSICAGAAVALSLATAANAAIPSYPDGGTENPLTYSFTATADGDLVAYFAGTGAAFSEVLGVLVNGVDSGVTGLENQTSTVGDSLNFGAVNAGDLLTFYINVNSGQYIWYSDKSLNLDGIGGGTSQHVWSTSYAGGDAGIPAGVYVGFEDLPRDGTDLNYGDLTFVFSNVSAVTTDVPEPQAWALMLLGFGVSGAMLRRRRASPALA